MSKAVSTEMRIYEDVHCTSENRLEPRSYYIPEGKSEYTLLNGKWRFAYFDRDIDVPEDINKWDTIDVPSCWQLRGYGSPNYTNINYPYPCDPPYVPDTSDNTGVMLYAGMFGVAAISLIVLFVFKRKKSEE